MSSVMINASLLRTSTFRLAAVYLVIFVISVGAILGYVYISTTVLIEHQTDETIDAEVQGLAEQYRVRGLNGLLTIIKERSKNDSGAVYLLVNQVGRRVAGNLDALPTDALGKRGWIEFPYRREASGDDRQRMARAFFIQLDRGYHLLAGRDVRERRHLARIIRDTLFWAIALALIFGISGGILVSRNFLKRIDSITHASRAIIAGNLGQRMAIDGTGDELDRLAENLNEMLDQIERLMVGMREVSSNVAHDLKTPLARLRATAEAALREGNSEQYRHALEKTLHEADGLIATFNALLSIARAETGQTRGGFEEFDLQPMLDDLAEMYAPVVEDTGGTLVFDCSDGIKLNGDRQLVAQAITNLIDNALKYGTDENGMLTLSLNAVKNDGQVIISVADHGPGVPEQDHERVVKRFVRLDESRNKPGNGLGLSLVNGVMTLHNGQLDLNDNQPGLKVILRFPAD